MTSPPLTDQKQREDPVEPLRVLVADLHALVGRLELKEHTPGLQATLKATQERVGGPRAVVLLLSEHADLKRQFLERLLGPDVAMVPNPTTVCTRLEYEAEPACTVTVPPGLATLPPDELKNSPGHGAATDAAVSTIGEPIQAIRLPNPSLKGGLAVIDTPAVESSEPAASVLECIEQADAWILVLNKDHALGEASQAWLRRLPERGARLEIVVENADALSSEERLAARERLMKTLREHCDIETPRLTLVSSTATEGDEGNFWHGRFATFHSVMMLRGRERSLEGTRTMVLDALSKVEAEIDCELKSIAPGVRHARLRLGKKDLDGLRMRFRELGGRDSERPHEKKTMDPQTETAPARSLLDDLWSGAGDNPVTEPAATADLSPLTMLAEAIAAIGPEGAEIEAAKPKADAGTAAPDVAQAAVGSAGVNIATKQPEGAPNGGSESPNAEIGASLIQPAGVPEAVVVRSNESVARPRPKHGLSVHFSENAKRLMPHGGTGESGKLRLVKRVVGVALVIAFVCLILWALAPRGFLFGYEPPAEWDYQQPKPALANPIAPAVTGGSDTTPVQPGDRSALPDPTNTATPNIPATPLTRHKGTVRTPLVHPIPSGEAAGVPQLTKRHHRHLLGLGKLWHWVRHPHHDKSEQSND